MPRYLLLLREPPEVARGLSPEEMQRIILQYRAWVDRLSETGHFVGAAPLDNSGVVARGSGHRIVVRDGPLVESKEIVGGFILLDAESYEAVIELLRDYPLTHLDHGSVEVRRVDTTRS